VPGQWRESTLADLIDRRNSETRDRLHEKRFGLEPARFEIRVGRLLVAIGFEEVEVTHEQGLIISTGDFSSGAREEAQRANAVPTALTNGNQLVNLLVEHEILTQKTPHVLLDLDEDAGLDE
jgi:restriction system protein